MLSPQKWDVDGHSLQSVEQEVQVSVKSQMPLPQLYNGSEKANADKHDIKTKNKTVAFKRTTP